MTHEAKTTTDHQTIRQWSEARGGVPATVKGTAGGEPAGLLRIAFSEGSEHLWNLFPGKISLPNLKNKSWPFFIRRRQKKAE